MLALITTVFFASLLGSLHCAGMCGPFVAFAVGTDTQAGGNNSKTALHAAYHGGRLVTYAALGAVGGALGAALDLGGSLVGLQRSAAVLAGGMMIVFGVLACLRYGGVRLRHAPIPAVLQRFVLAGHRAAAGWRPVPRALLIGLLTTLLPCGWLYAFAITAAGTGRPLWGAVTMAAFWAGTVPTLALVGVGVRKLAGTFGAKLPLVTSLAIVVVGVLTIVQRLHMPAAAFAALARQTPASVEQAVQQAAALPAREMPCCAHEP